MEASRPVQLAQFQGHQSTTAFKPKLHLSCLWFHFQSPMPHSSQSRSSRSRRNTKHTAGCRCDTSYCTVKKKKKMPLSRETTVRFCCIGIVEVHGNGSTQPRKKKSGLLRHPTFEKRNIRWVVCLKTTHGVAKSSARCSRCHLTNFIGGWGSRARHTSKVKINVLYESSVANTNSSRGTLVLRRRRFDHRKCRQWHQQTLYMWHQWKVRKQIRRKTARQNFTIGYSQPHLRLHGLATVKCASLGTHATFLSATRHNVGMRQN